MLIDRAAEPTMLWPLAGTAVAAALLTLWTPPPPDALDLDTLQLAEVDCEGRRACGDRRHRLVEAPLLGNPRLADDACVGGRRTCGDRTATPAPPTPTPTTTANSAVPHPRTLAR